MRDDELRRMYRSLTEPAQRAADPPPPETIVRRGRRRRRRTAAGALLVVALLAVGGAIALRPPAADRGEVLDRPAPPVTVPRTTTPPTTTTRAPARAAGATSTTVVGSTAPVEGGIDERGFWCAAADLSGAQHGQVEGATGTLYYTVYLRNRTNRLCDVRGVPEVRMLGPDGRPLPVRSEPENSLPAQSVVLGPGEAAQLVISHDNLCVGPRPSSRRLRVRFTDGSGSLVVTLDDPIEPCGALLVRRLKPAGDYSP